MDPNRSERIRSMFSMTQSRLRVRGARMLSWALVATGLLAACTNQPSSIPGDAPGKTESYSISLVAPTLKSLPKCAPPLLGTTAYVRAPASLYSCQAGIWIPILCNDLLGGAVAYASDTQTLLACVSGQWSVVPLPPGPPGAMGPTGAKGAPGATGQTGPMGANGQQGDAGNASLIVQIALPAGTACPYGGTELESGVDQSGDGQLQSAEVKSISYLCNGAPGDAGADGPRGPAGAPGPQVTVTPEPPGPNCATGGERIDIGGDPAAGASTTYICNGVAAPLLRGVCNANDACTSGLCLGGFCCATACDTADATCGATACSADGACTYPRKGLRCGAGQSCADATLTTNTCSGAGVCRTSVESCPNAFACASASSCLFSCADNSQCVDGFTCNLNHCVGAILPGGKGCSIDADCASGLCDGNSNVCCASSTPCPGPVESQCSTGLSEFGDTFCAAGTGACGVEGQGQQCSACVGNSFAEGTCDAVGQCQAGSFINGNCGNYACFIGPSGADCYEDCDTGVSPCGCTDNSQCAPGYVCMNALDFPPQPCIAAMGLACTCKLPS